MTLTNTRFGGTLVVAPNYDFDQDKLFQEFSDDPCRRYVLEDVHGFAAWLRKRGYIA